MGKILQGWGGDGVNFFYRVILYSESRHNKYWQWSWLSLGNKQRVLRNKSPITRTAGILRGLISYRGSLYNEPPT